MSRHILLLFSLFVWAACASDHIDTEADTTPPAATPAAAPKAAKQPAARAVNGQTVPTTDETLLLTALSTQVAAGKEACVQFRADGFTGILGTQYTIRWDADKLRYKKTQVGQFPGFTAQNINESMTKEGLLPLAWIDNELRGVTLPAGTVLYQLCFDAIGAAGTQATVGFTNKPTSYEVVNVAEQILTFRGQDGTVTIE